MTNTSFLDKLPHERHGCTQDAFSRRDKGLCQVRITSDDESFSSSPKELLARQRLCAYKIVTKGFVGNDECRINFEPPGFKVKCSECWSVDVVLNMDLLNKQLCLFIFIFRKKITWMNLKKGRKQQRQSEWVKRLSGAAQQVVFWLKGPGLLLFAVQMHTVDFAGPFSPPFVSGDAALLP